MVIYLISFLCVLLSGTAIIITCMFMLLLMIPSVGLAIVAITLPVPFTILLLPLLFSLIVLCLSGVFMRVALCVYIFYYIVIFQISMNGSQYL